MITNAIKVVLAFLLLGCLLKMPYGYFQFIRLAGCAGFAYLAYTELERKSLYTGIPCIGAAILLNPVIKVHFPRETWNFIDMILGVLLLLWVIIDIIMNIKSDKK